MNPPFPLFFGILIFIVPAFFCSLYSLGWYLVFQKVTFPLSGKLLPPLVALFLILVQPFLIPVIIQTNTDLIISLFIPVTVVAMANITPWPFFEGRINFADPKIIILVCGTFTALFLIISGAAAAFGSGNILILQGLLDLIEYFIPDTVPFRWFIIRSIAYYIFCLIAVTILYLFMYSIEWFMDKK